jgi:hypothetical protein
MVTINHNYVEDSEHTMSVALNQFNTTDFVVVLDTPSECKLRNLTSPLGLEETVQYRVSSIPNIYQNSGVERNLWTPTVGGVRANVHHDERWSLSDSENADWDYVIPNFCDITFKVANNPYISESDIRQMLLRTVSSILNSDGLSRIAKLMRGAMNPKE